MPYPNIDSLPDGVKALPKEAQEIWRNAFNSAVKDKDEETANKIAWGAVKNAGFLKEGDKWVKKNDMEAPLDHEFEVFSVGTWNGDKYTEADLDEMVKNFGELQGAIKPPLKLGHADEGINKKLKDGQPALGWVTNLKRNGEKLVATVTGMPEAVLKAIQKGLYKRISCEIFWNLKIGDKVYKRVLSAVALLGASIPAVTNLKDLEVFLSRSMLEGASFDGCKAYSFDMAGSGHTISGGKGMDMDTIKKEYETKLADEKKKREDAEAKIREYEAAQVKKVKEDREGEFKTFCEEQVKAGKITPAQRDILTAKHTYTDEGGITIGFDSFKEFMEKGGKILDLKEHGKDKKGDEGDFKNVFDEADKKIRDYAREKKMSYIEASKIVFAEDKDLAKRYLDATPRSIEED